MIVRSGRPPAASELIAELTSVAISTLKVWDALRASPARSMWATPDEPAVFNPSLRTMVFPPRVKSGTRFPSMTC